MLQQIPLFGNYTLPETEGIKYAGSKLKLLPHILKLVNEVTPSTILDGFSGTTRVAQALARLGYEVIANDVAVWSEVFGTCYLLNTEPQHHYEALISHLNALPGKDGWFTENYGGLSNGGVSVQQDGLKKPWQIHNTRKLDAIREEIDQMGLDEVERSIALTSLILALDSVDNTLGHYAAYLRAWSARSFDTMNLQVPQLFVNQVGHQVFREDIFDLLDKVTVDLAYLDPPYGSNNEKMPPSRVRYAAYYHVWTTVCENDRPKLFGKARRRVDTRDKLAASVFEEFRSNEETGEFIAVEAIGRLLQKVRANHIILSYSSGGRATAEALHRVISRCGSIKKIVQVDYKKNVMAGMTWTNEWVSDAEQPHQEFLFLIEK